MTAGPEGGVPASMNLAEPAGVGAAGNDLILACLARRRLGLPESH